MSKNSRFQTSRRQLLSQGVNTSLGLIFTSQFWSGKSQSLDRISLLALASPPLPSPASKASSQGPITVTIHFVAKTGKAEALTTQLLKALPNARAAQGCRYAHFYGQAYSPNEMVLFKGWDSREAQIKYLQWEQSSGRLAQIIALVEGEPTVEYWEFQQV